MTNERWLKWAIARYYRSEGYKVSMKPARVGNAMVDGIAIGPEGERIAMMVQPTLTNVVTATRTETESSVSPITTEVTSVYVSTSTESTIAGTITTRLTTCSWSCHSGYDFFPTATIYWYQEEEGMTVAEWAETLVNVCILYYNETAGEVRDRQGAVLSCGTATNTYLPTRPEH